MKKGVWKNPKHNGINNIGLVFGKLTIISKDNTFTQTRKHRHKYICQCECGNTKSILWENLSRGTTVSCGCFMKEVNSGEKENRRLPVSEMALNRVYNQYRCGAERRDILFLLNKEEFKNIIERDCFYCGIEPSLFTSRKILKGEYFHNGIDRVNSFLNYTVDNCVACCSKCNFMKRSYSLLEFTTHIERIYNNINNKNV